MVLLADSLEVMTQRKQVVKNEEEDQSDENNFATTLKKAKEITDDPSFNQCLDKAISIMENK